MAPEPQVADPCSSRCGIRQVGVHLNEGLLNEFIYYEVAKLQLPFINFVMIDRAMLKTNSASWC